MSDLVQVGLIIKTHGLKGGVKVKITTDFPDVRFKKGNVLYLNDGSEVQVKSFKKAEDSFGYLLFENLLDINLVETLKGKSLFAKKDETLLEEDHYYYDDLIGLDVYQNNILIGKVTEIMVTNIYILRVSGDKNFLLPLVKSHIEKIDLTSRRIDIVEYEGLYEN